MLTKQIVNSIIGVLICAWAATSASLLFWGHNSRTSAPLWFLFVIAAIAICYGFKSAFYGTWVATLIFFAFLISPFRAAGDRIGSFNVVCMTVGGTVISYVLSKPATSTLSDTRKLGTPTPQRHAKLVTRESQQRVDSPELSVGDEEHEIKSV